MISNKMALPTISIDDIKKARLLGTYDHPEHRGAPDRRLRVYLIGDVRAAESNCGGAVWEEEDPLAFARLLVTYGAKPSIGLSTDRLRAILGDALNDLVGPTGWAYSENEAIAKLQRHDWWGEHPAWPRSDWQSEIAAGDTQLSYWAWVEHRHEEGAEDEPRKSTVPLPQAIGGRPCLARGQTK
jgi:hypothetical protein